MKSQTAMAATEDHPS